MPRMFFGLAAFAVTGFLVVASARTAEPGQPPKIPLPPVPQIGPNQVDPRMPQFTVCAKACDDCARACDLCAAHCANLLTENRKEHLATLRTCLDCATICAATSRVVAKDGPMSDLIVTACAETCKRCGDACAKHADGDPIMKQCAAECRKCEEVCRDMLVHLKPRGEANPKK